MKTQSRDAFRAALNNACGEINEAARLSEDIFTAEELASVRRELARLMETIDSNLLNRLGRGETLASRREKHCCLSRGCTLTIGWSDHVAPVRSGGVDDRNKVPSFLVNARRSTSSLGTNDLSSLF